MYQYLLGKVSTAPAGEVKPPAGMEYQYLLGKVSTGQRKMSKLFVVYQYLLGKVSTCPS